MKFLKDFSPYSIEVYSVAESVYGSSIISVFFLLNSILIG